MPIKMKPTRINVTEIEPIKATEVELAPIKIPENMLAGFLRGCRILLNLEA